jgi:hypothetical protein
MVGVNGHITVLKIKWVAHQRTMIACVGIWHYTNRRGREEDGGQLVARAVSASLPQPLTNQPGNLPTNQTVYDVAFNDTGTLLYAWMVDGVKAAILMYRVDAGNVRLETTPSYYNYVLSCP